tara:strand:+ start:209 stop:1183 length:975 start_codon:yes stop_codon:yes gene_type:complete
VTQRLEDYWLGLRLQQLDIPAIHLLKADDVQDNSPLLLDAVEMYLSIKRKTDKTFIRTARRNATYVVKVLGNKPITSYATSGAAQFRDWCFEQGMSLNTVKRVFAAVRSIINLIMREHGIEGTNAFSGTFMPESPDASPRQPIPNDILRVIQKQCESTDDEMRWLVALLTDTGMRLSEAAGLTKADVHLDEEIPFVHITPHRWRRLKTRGSTRKIPLVGFAYWAAKRARDCSANGFLFPKYCNSYECHSNSASAALNRWLKQTAGNNFVIHSLRHSMRDRLRSAQCPTDMIDQICGWQPKTIGHSYGEGYPLYRLKQMMVLIEL